MKNLLLSLILITLSVLSFSQSKEYPEARKNHTMVEINGIIYMFGGESADKGDPLNDLWAFNRGNNEWTKKTTTNPPEARKYHTAVALEGKMYVHGGQTSNGAKMDMWVYDPNTEIWVELETENDPPPKLFQRAVASEGQVFVTGGYDESSGNTVSEVWAFNPNYNTWTQKTDMPIARYGHVSFFNDLKVYVTCGRSGNELYNDMYVYDITQDNWAEKSTNGNPTAVKFAANGSSDDFLLITGGSYWDGANFVDCGETWEYQVSDNTWSQKPDGPVFSFGAGVLSSDSKTDEYSGFFFGGSRDLEVLDESWFYYSSSGWTMVGIEDIEPISDGIKVFPTISSGTIQIQSQETINSIYVFDIFGKMIWQSRQINEQEKDINLQDQPNGIYFIQIKSNNKSYSEKIQILR